MATDSQLPISDLPQVVAGKPGRPVTIAVAALLVAAVAIVFAQTARHEFVNYDDTEYVYGNPMVRAGLTRASVVEAFSRFCAANWHPLTWISHILDWQFYADRPAGHHVTSLVIHALAAVALLFALRRMTGTVWPAAWVAAAFAIHPLRAESVAWVAERKDVLSGLFFMLTLWAYAGYVRRPDRHGPYLRLLLFYALGLLCKPMLVSVPFVLLLLDYWPLQRRTTDAAAPMSASLRPLIVEKIPLFMLSAVSCVTTIFAQRGSMSLLAPVAWPWRVANAATAYVGYLAQFLWPTNLAVLYPHPRAELPVWKVGICLVLIGFATGFTILKRRTCPHLLVGWLWYLVMLLPVIGLVQVGRQAMADRYTYLPLIGIAFAIAWHVRLLVEESQSRRVACGMASAALLAVWMIAAWHQTAYWRNSETLWARALNATARNSVAHNQMASVLVLRGDLAAAVDHWRRALEIDPDHHASRENLGHALFQQGDYAGGLSQWREGVRRGGTDASLLRTLAWVLATWPDPALRNGAEAVAVAEQASQRDDHRDPATLATLAAAYAEAGRYADAVHTAKLARQQATDFGNQDLAAAIAAQLAEYEAGRPWRDPSNGAMGPGN